MNFRFSKAIPYHTPPPKKKKKKWSFFKSWKWVHGKFCKEQFTHTPLTFGLNCECDVKMIWMGGGLNQRVKSHQYRDAYFILHLTFLFQEFVSKYNVTFDMFSKINVNGGDAHPLFAFLKVGVALLSLFLLLLLLLLWKLVFLVVLIITKNEQGVFYSSKLWFSELNH